MPLFDDRKSSKWPTQGYESLPARCARLEHQCLSYLLQPFEERTANKKHSVLWGGDEKRQITTYYYLSITHKNELQYITALLLRIKTNCNILLHINS